jgi:PAS domain S-box-containing protein
MLDNKELEANTIDASTRKNSSASFEEGMVFQDARGYVLAVNPAAANILGLTTDQLMGCTSLDPSWQTIHEDGSPFEGETHPAMVALSTGKPCTNAIVGFYRPSGELVWIKIDSHPLFQDSQTEPYGVVTTFSDITERQAALRDRQQTDKNSTPIEEDLLLAINTSNDAFWNWNVLSKKVFFSSRWKQMRGYQDHEIGESEEEWSRRIHPDDRDRVKEAVEAHFAKKTPYFQEEYRVRCKDGSYIWILDRGQAFWNEDGNVVQMVGSETDITERKQVERSLELSEQRIESLARLAPVGIFRSDRIGNCIYVNDRCCEMMGLPAAASLGEGWARAVHPEDRDRVTSEWMETVEKNLPFYSEFRFLRDDGTIRWAIGQAVAETDETERLIGYIGTITDITDRKQSEIALHQTNQRIINIWESMTDAYVNLDREWRIIYANQVAIQTIQQLTHLESEEFLGRSHWEIFPSLVGGEVEREYRRAVSEQIALHLEVPYEPTGNWFEAHAYPSAEGLGIYFHDISDRKRAEVALRESENRYRTLFESIDEGFGVCEMLFDENGTPNDYRFLEVNPAFEKMTGLEQPTGKTARELVPNLEASWFDIYGRVALTGEPVRVENQSIAMNRWFDVNAFRVGEPQDRKFAVLFTNITDRKRADKERERLLEREKAAREELETANRVKDEFMAILSHELRSPLNPILGWTQLLKTYKLDPEKLDRGLETIDRNAKLLLELIDDLLDVAKILRGKITLNLAPVNLIKAIEGALETVSAAAKAKSIEIETRLTLVERVDGDLARLQQIFWNLLSNAVKFTNNGGKVEVRVDRVGDAAQITVSDNGKGIAPEFLPHVFEYFRQADGSVTRKHGGLGLGLAIVRHLVELHGGVIAVTSPGLDFGATFIVSLPISKPQSDSNNSDFSSSNLLTNRSNLEGVKILIVDDDRDNLDFLTMALECDRASVASASSATEALAIFEEFVPDILISDIAMPDMDGLTLIKSIRSRSPETGGEIPALALSAYAREIERERAIAAGFQAHIAKPVNISFLNATILQLMSRI